MKKVLLALLIGHFVVGAVQAAAVDEARLESLRAEAARGDTAAQYEMGVLYEFGFNMPDNLSHALAWYMVAAEQGNERAAKRRDLLQSQLTGAQVDEARRLRAQIATVTPARREPAASESAPAPAPAAAPESMTVPVPEPKPDEPK